MISSGSMEILAHQSLTSFTALCGCNDPNEVADALIQLIGLCSLTIRMSLGQDEAVSRLTGVVEYISSSDCEDIKRQSYIQ